MLNNHQLLVALVDGCLQGLFAAAAAAGAEKVSGGHQTDGEEGEYVSHRPGYFRSWSSFSQHKSRR